MGTTVEISLGPLVKEIVKAMDRQTEAIKENSSILLDIYKVLDSMLEAQN